LVAYDVNNCGTFTDTIGISLKKATASAGIDRDICLGSTITIGGGTYPAGTTYTWTPSTNLSASNVATPTVLGTLTSPTTYSLVIARPITEQEATFTCASAPDAVNVTLKAVPAPPTITRTSASDIACQGGTGITLAATNIVGSVQWYRASSVGPTTTSITETSTGGVARAYTARNLSNGCYSAPSNSLTITVVNAPKPTITSSVGSLQSGSATQINVCPTVTSAVFTAAYTTSAGTVAPTYAWYNPAVSSTTVIGTGNTLAVSGITTNNLRRNVIATYVYPSITCTATSATMDIRQSATATGCRVMQNEEETFENILSVYPNPTEKMLNAKIQVTEAGEATLTLVNSLGQNIWTEKRNLEEGDTDIQLSLEALPAGIYILSFDKENVHQSVKIVKE
ncbi:MAG: T9SS type A sorting domain-containing protein, partial [Bacteroidia bacterium]